MDEYISKTKFEELMRKKARSNFDLYYVDKEKHYHDKAIGYNTAADEVHDFPTVDVQPIKKGHWYHNTSKYISELDAYFIQACCSCCGRYSDSIDAYSQIMSNENCSHCGARMIKDGDING